MHGSCSLMPDGLFGNTSWGSGKPTCVHNSDCVHYCMLLCVSPCLLTPGGGLAVRVVCTSMHMSADAPPPMQAFLGANVGPSGRKHGALRIGFGLNSKGNSGGFSSMICCCSAAQSCPTLCDPMDCSTRGFPVLHHVPKFAQTHESVMPSNHLILCCPLLLLPSIFPSIRVFSNESALLIRWPEYCSFSVSSSSKYSGLIPLGLTGLLSFHSSYILFLFKTHFDKDLFHLTLKISKFGAY